MRSLFSAFCGDQDDVEVRCLLFASVFIANNFLVADHGARSRRELLDLTLKRLLA
jgi:hypothetical protein